MIVFPTGARRASRAPKVIAQLNEKWRVVNDSLQWILQRRSGTQRAAGDASPKVVDRYGATGASV